MKNPVLYIIQRRAHITNVDQHENFKCFAIIKSDSKWINTAVFRGHTQIADKYDKWPDCTDSTTQQYCFSDSADSVIWINIIIMKWIFFKHKNCTRLDFRSYLNTSTEILSSTFNNSVISLEKQFRKKNIFILVGSWITEEKIYTKITHRN